MLCISVTKFRSTHTNDEKLVFSASICPLKPQHIFDVDFDTPAVSIKVPTLAEQMCFTRNRYVCGRIL